MRESSVRWQREGIESRRGEGIGLRGGGCEGRGGVNERMGGWVGVRGRGRPRVWIT